ncbi:uncharacterized protein LOC142598166 [Dermatophagoides farinae]|uniref:uncharacterized protein LOC142598166 n=1 Tax=Dermatophagoides farinae TaxID=6954 RepID=UPI003F623498
MANFKYIVCSLFEFLLILTIIVNFIRAQDIDRENRCSSEGFFRDPNDCVKFYRCTRDEGADFFRVYEFACGPGTVFDPTISVCNHPGSSPPCENNGQQQQQQLPEYNAANQPQQPEQYSSQPQQQVPSTSSDSYPNQQTSPNNYYEQPSIIAAPYPQSQPSEQQQSPNNAGYPSSQQPGSTYNQQPNNYNPDEWSSAYGQPYSSDQSPTNQYPDHRDYLPEQFGDPPSQQEQQQPESPAPQQQQPESPHHNNNNRNHQHHNNNNRNHQRHNNNNQNHQYHNNNYQISPKTMLNNN